MALKIGHHVKMFMTKRCSKNQLKIFENLDARNKNVRRPKKLIVGRYNPKSDVALLLILNLNENDPNLFQ